VGVGMKVGKNFGNWVEEKPERSRRDSKAIVTTNLSEFKVKV
jgi:hypothetical protein